MGGKFTPAKVVDDINANTSRYRNVKYVIENMQSGELAKGLEEALVSKGIPARRVIFTNFPKSVPGVESLPDVLRYNKGLVMPGQTGKTQAATQGVPANTEKGEQVTKTPLGVAACIPVVFAAALLLARRRGA
jgi:zinc/manganese transport system substrate-binding protein